MRNDATNEKEIKEEMPPNLDLAWPGHSASLVTTAAPLSLSTFRRVNNLKPTLARAETDVALTRHAPYYPTPIAHGVSTARHANVVVSMERPSPCANTREVPRLPRVVTSVAFDYLGALPESPTYFFGLVTDSVVVALKALPSLHLTVVSTTPAVLETDSRPSRA